MNPFFIEGPAVISFSGGRTSGYLLWRILDAMKRLPPDVHVMFANTGKERPETLDFVHEIETRWGVPIQWLEYRRRLLPKYKNPERAVVARRAREAVGRGHLYTPRLHGVKEPGYVEVTYETASRDGEPFDNLIDLAGLPNISTRLCTAEMKIRVIKKAMLAHGHKYWDVVLGLRADEPKRVANQRKPKPERWDIVMPLADAGIVEDDVLRFWREQPFDLQLASHEGNCDICPLKTLSKRTRIAQARPDLLEWWVGAEARTGDVFKRHEPPYHKLPTLPVVPETEDAVACFCTD